LIICILYLCRLPVNECQASQTARVTSNLHASSSTMAVSRVPSPPLPEVNTPVAENWCYTQVRHPLIHPPAFTFTYSIQKGLNYNVTSLRIWSKSFAFLWICRQRVFSLLQLLEFQYTVYSIVK